MSEGPTADRIEAAIDHLHGLLAEWHRQDADRLSTLQRRVEQAERNEALARSQARSSEKGLRECQEAIARYIAATPPIVLDGAATGP